MLNHVTGIHMSTFSKKVPSPDEWVGHKYYFIKPDERKFKLPAY